MVRTRGMLPSSQKSCTAALAVPIAAPAVTTGSAAMVVTIPSRARPLALRSVSCQLVRARAGADASIAYPFRPVVLMPSTSSRWKATKKRKTGSSESTAMANIGPMEVCPPESMNSRSPMGTVYFFRSFR